MRTNNRAYSEELNDFKKIVEFFVEYNDYITTYTSFSLPRFIDWKYGLYPPRTNINSFWTKNAQLWFDELNNLVGFVISEGGATDINIITAPGFRFIFKDILEWVLINWKNRDKLSLEISEKQTFEIDVLFRYNFKNSFTAYKRYFDLTKDICNKYTLESGFKIIDMENTPEYREQRILRANALDGIENLTEEELKNQLIFYYNTHQAPTYHPKTDLCIKTSEGLHVAGCEALLNPYNCDADLERICTHSKYRRRGFGKVIIQECLIRLKEMGYKKAYITGYSNEAINLYGSLGAIGETKIFIYKLEK